MGYLVAMAFLVIMSAFTVAYVARWSATVLVALTVAGFGVWTLFGVVVWSLIQSS